ncbi:MAG TPA: hypothetical protein VJ790_13985, partial [Dongiaceae bacterium]|nr:hypothetical protein [Dongiaceae bacterium]
MKHAKQTQEKRRNSKRRRRNRSLTGEKVRFDERTLERIPLAERTLLLGVWHATNELNTLRKL